MQRKDIKLIYRKLNELCEMKLKLANLQSRWLFVGERRVYGVYIGYSLVFVEWLVKHLRIVKKKIEIDIRKKNYIMQ